MRTRLFLLFAFAAVTVLTNAASAGNIAHGVEVVVIDPGHGGNDPGAHYGGTSEKDLTLKVALKLGKMIEEGMPGVKVVYTRKTDKALGPDKAKDLQARADIANKAGGDLFISIHVNAAKSTAARGVETLIMGESPKEQRYNENALFENNREDLIDMSDERTAAIVRAYIQNLQFTYGEYSMAIARCIQNNYLKAGRHSRGIKPQLLRVLYATDMPGVLTEIARSIYEGVKNYSAYVLETRNAEEEAAAAPKAEQKPEQVVVGKEPVRGAGGKAGAKDSAAKSESVTAPAERETSETQTPKTETPKAGAPKRETPKAETPKQPAPKQDAQPLRYTVQVLASPQTVPASSERFKSYRGKVKQYTADGKYRYKYCVGEYETRAAAQKQLAAVRKVFPDAFVVSCRGTRIVK